MAKELYIPKMGQTVEEVILVKWLRKEGDVVNRGDEVLEVETDKAVFPVEANGKGVLHVGPFKEGQVIPILTVVAVIGKADDTFQEQKSAEVAETGRPSAEEEPEAVVPIQPGSTMDTEKVFISPRARKAAKEIGVDLSLVVPSGAGGIRIVEKDVIDYHTSLPKISPVARKLAEQRGVEWVHLQGSGPEGKIIKEDVLNTGLHQEVVGDQSTTDAAEARRVPYTGIRKIIADRMSASVQTSARVTLVIEVDATSFVEARARLKELFEKDWGFAPGYLDLLAQIVTVALGKFPYMNAQLRGDEIWWMNEINLGIAVDTDRGLLVPVIRDVPNKGLQVFGKEFRELAEKARTNRLLPDLLEGGTFTITNLGMYDIDAFTPVINLPEAAILGVGRIMPKPVVVGDEIVIHKMWTLSLVFDHRLVDGGPAARFLQYIKQVIEDPYLLLL